jgi:hypothetical protein
MVLDHPFIDDYRSMSQKLMNRRFFYVDLGH